MRRGIIRSKRFQNVVDSLITYIDQHVGICESLHRSRLLPLVGSDKAVVQIATVIVLCDLLVSDRYDPIVIVLEPPAVLLGLDQSKVVTTVQITRMDEHSV